MFKFLFLILLFLPPMIWAQEKEQQQSSKIQIEFKCIQTEQNVAEQLGVKRPELIKKTKKSRWQKNREVFESLKKTKVTLDLKGVPLTEALKYLQDISGIPIQLSPKVKEQMPAEQRLVHLSIQDISLVNVLRLILTLKKLESRVINGKIFISTHIDTKNLNLMLFDVRDLVAQDDKEAEKTPLTFKTLKLIIENEIKSIQIIKNENTSISFQNGTMIVKHFPETLELIDHILRSIRKSIEKRIPTYPYWEEDTPKNPKSETFSENKPSLKKRKIPSKKEFVKLVIEDLHQSAPKKSDLEEKKELELGSIKTYKVNSKQLESLVLQNKFDVFNISKLLVKKNQPFKVSALDNLSYLQDYDIKVAQDLTIIDPIIGRTEFGIEIRGFLRAEFEKSFEIESIVTLKTLNERPIPISKTDFGPIQLPSLTDYSIKLKENVELSQVLLCGPFPKMWKEKYQGPFWLVIKTEIKP